jgi:hypothetical protein
MVYYKIIRNNMYAFVIIMFNPEALKKDGYEKVCATGKVAFT